MGTGFGEQMTAPSTGPPGRSPCLTVAGLAAAIACARQGFSVTVCERSAGISPHGDSILFGANASRIFYRWGIGGDLYRRGGSRGGRWIFQDEKGKMVEQVQIGDM